MDLVHGAKGLARHGRDRLTGNTHTERELAAIAGVCAVCPSLKKYKSKATGRRVCYCGIKGVNAMESVLRTCGCLVLKETHPVRAHVTIDGVSLRAAGKPVGRSEKCPQDRW